MLLQQFLCAYEVIPIPKTVSDMSPTELIFARKCTHVFSNLLQNKKVEKQEKASTQVYFKHSKKYSFELTKIKMNAGKMG